jgi:hypothetical protein
MGAATRSPADQVSDDARAGREEDGSFAIVSHPVGNGRNYVYNWPTGGMVGIVGLLGR